MRQDTMRSESSEKEGQLFAHPQAISPIPIQHSMDSESFNQVTIDVINRPKVEGNFDL